MTQANETERVLRLVLARVDFAALGDLYCDYGGDEFWADRREPLVELGLRWAAAVVRRVPAAGTSFYLGAGIAELPALIAEHIQLGRQVIPVSQRARECDLLNAALGAVLPAIRFRVGDGAIVAGEATFDHLSCVSVLSDPESFPTSSAVSYGRVHAAQVEPEALAVEQARIRSLVAAVTARLARPAWVTTTVEEVPWFLEWAGHCGAKVQAEEEMVETAIVGDPIGFLGIA